MKNQSGRCIRGWVLGIALLAAAHARAAGPGDEKSEVLLSTMQQELQRAQASLGKLDPAPYFLSYSVYDQSVSSVVGSQGALINSTGARRRSTDVVVRIGSPALDNSHLVRGASFGDLDTRALRSDLAAAGDHVYVDNRPQIVPHSIVAPSILFDELEVKRANINKEKLPEYPAPGLLR